MANFFTYNLNEKFHYFAVEIYYPLIHSINKSVSHTNKGNGFFQLGFT